MWMILMFEVWVQGSNESLKRDVDGGVIMVRVRCGTVGAALFFCKEGIVCIWIYEEEWGHVLVGREMHGRESYYVFLLVLVSFHEEVVFVCFLCNGDFEVVIWC